MIPFTRPELDLITPPGGNADSIPIAARLWVRC